MMMMTMYSHMTFFFRGYSCMYIEYDPQHLPPLEASAVCHGENSAFLLLRNKEVCENEGIATTFLTSAVDGGGISVSSPGRSTPAESPARRLTGTQWRSGSHLPSVRSSYLCRLSYPGSNLIPNIIPTTLFPKTLKVRYKVLVVCEKS
jgi:hypothetical protein